MAGSSMDTEAAAGHELKQGSSGYSISATAHTVDTDSWQQVGLLMVIGFNCAYVLSFSNLMMVPLGWAWGVACLLLVGAAAWYANWLLAGLHFIDGQRFIRYRDLMGFVFVHHSTSVQHGLHFTRRKSTQGESNKQKDYNIHGTQAEKVFSALGAVAAILVCNTSGLLPEIQSTVREPAVRGMRLALLLQYTAGAAGYYGISVAGYWAYGSAVSEYLPNELGGPRWAAVLINATAFLQSIVSQHLFTVPIHEAMDTRLQRLDEGMFSRYNLTRRLCARGLVFGFNVFVTALFPFMGDFVNLVGSFALVPLTFTFPSMVILKIEGKSGGRWNRLWHWGIIVFSSLLCVATTAAAVRLIFNNARIYHFFADM